jgi:hypothetical protein
VSKVLQQPTHFLNLVDDELWSNQNSIFAMREEKYIEIFDHLQKLPYVLGFTILDRVVSFVSFELNCDRLLLSLYLRENAFTIRIFFHREKNCIDIIESTILIYWLYSKI